MLSAWHTEGSSPYGEFVINDLDDPQVIPAGGVTPSDTVSLETSLQQEQKYALALGVTLVNSEATFSLGSWKTCFAALESTGALSLRRTREMIMKPTQGQVRRTG